MFLLLVFLWMPVLIFRATAADFETRRCEVNITSHINNTSFYPNLVKVLDSLATDTAVNYKRFKTERSGSIPPDIAYGLYLCRADALPNDCRNCLLNAREDLNMTCSFSKEAVAWSDHCMLRYANYSIGSVLNYDTFIPECNKENISELVSEQNKFWKAATNFLGRLANHVSKDENGMFAYNELPYNDKKIYGYVQCTPDLSGSDCNKCLQVSIDRLRGQYCYGKEGARVLAASCNVRFEIYKFLQFSTPSSEKPGRNENQSKIIAAIVAVVAFLVIIAAICYLAVIKKWFRPIASGQLKEKTDHIDESEIITEQSLQFELGTVEQATKNFSIENKVGEGGFGVVYKGILANGQEIAVKRLSKGSVQGSLEFKNEVVLLAKLQHRNLVRLLGFCLHAEEKILIYEYVANHSLDFFLFGHTKDVKLDWSTRYKIIGGIARGMLYLHEDSRLRIIHRDLKTSNILLDEEMNPKISDFGMARIVCASQTQSMTNRIVGTVGYMSPEYAMHGHFSVKSDVFSFGVLVLEIISGKKNTRFFQSGYVDLLCFTWSKWKNGESHDILDSNLVDSSSVNEALHCINIALLCVQEDDELRPSMASVVHMLNSCFMALPIPQNPPFVSQRRIEHTISEQLESHTSTRTIWPTDDSLITDVHPR
ncbi:cysteine-rich receptor-like protein kinase 15 [Bidens hawaiensis]|uniref:cysteine-rich receptor-like protein kinase 15 n=1 Tax=Bidens hawaiensis TaxID=980011 RepID=UPI00404B36A1